MRGGRSKSESVSRGSGSESVRTGVRLGIRLGSMIGWTTGTVVVGGVGVVFSGAAPFEKGEREVVKRLRLD